MIFTFKTYRSTSTVMFGSSMDGACGSNPRCNSPLANSQNFSLNCDNVGTYNYPIVYRILRYQYSMYHNAKSQNPYLHIHKLPVEAQLSSPTADSTHYDGSYLLWKTMMRLLEKAVKLSFILNIENLN